MIKIPHEAMSVHLVGGDAVHVTLYRDGGEVGCSDGKLAVQMTWGVLDEEAEGRIAIAPHHAALLLKLGADIDVSETHEFAGSLGVTVPVTLDDAPLPLDEQFATKENPVGRISLGPEYLRRVIAIQRKAGLSDWGELSFSFDGAEHPVVIELGKSDVITSATALLAPIKD